MNDRIKNIVAEQKRAEELGLEVNVMKMWQAFYEQHKQKHGSYKPLLQSERYIDLMQSRYDWILQQIKDTIDSKYRYSHTP